MDVWSGEFLEEMRQRADPLADAVVAALARAGQTAAVAELLTALVHNEDMPLPSLPALVQDYLRRSDVVPATDADLILAGEEVFELYGPEILMILGVYALPEAYAARKGVQVLHRSGYLQRRAMRRVWETTQFVVDVMGGGGLARGGMGVRTAQKVRLMHAAIRYLVGNDPARPWNASELGLPINQEDLAATLMTFSYVVLDGLRRLGVALDPLQQEAYLGAWRVVGLLLGVDPRLIPGDVDEASRLTRIIAGRQIAASAEGTQLVRALVDGLQELMPLGFEGFVPSAMRFFLEREPISGRDVAALLGIPPADWTGVLVDLAGGLADLGGRMAGEEPHVAAALRTLRMHYIGLLLRCQRGPGRPSFRIPERLRDLWTRSA